MMRRLLFSASALLVLVFFTANSRLSAQDIHFSQYYASPVSLNPAMTGLMDGCYRGAVQFRNQYPELYAYSTFSVAYDMALLKNSRLPGYLGAGLWMYNDRQGDGQLNHLAVNALLAYHLDITGDGRFLVSLGGMGGWSHKNLDFSRLLFASQQSGQVLDSTLPNGEAIQNNQFNYFDAAGGASFSARVNDRVGINAGFAMFNLLTPNESFLGDTENELGMRTVGHLSAQIAVNERISLAPSFIYMGQTGATEIIGGVNVGYIFNGGDRFNPNRSAAYLGLSYRYADAIIVLAGVEFSDIRFGLSYDINVSSLNNASLGQGGLELSLVYERRCYNTNQRGVPSVNCPRF